MTLEEQKAIELLGIMTKKDAVEWCESFINDMMFYRNHEFWRGVKREINKRS